MKETGLETQHLKTGTVMAREINILIRVALDFLCLLIVGLPILILHLVGKPYKRGFNCNDETLMYPFRDSTITNVTLYLVGILVPVSVILVTEFVRYKTRNRKLTMERRIFYRFNVHPLIWEWYVKIGVFAFGCCLSQMTTDIAKYSIGRLRPHFRAVCQPDVNCSINSERYITDFTCQNENAFLVRESRLSFLSGHSSFSAFTMVYVVLYLQARVHFRGLTLLRPFLQALALYAAWFTALSRISDYKHHWSDVLAGSIQGVLVALLVVFFISDLFPKKNNASASVANHDDSARLNAYRCDDTLKSDPEQGS